MMMMMMMMAAAARTLMMMIMFTFIAHDSINLNAQCAEVRKGGRERVIVIKIPKRKKTNVWCKVIQRTDGFSDVCRTPPNNLLP